MTMSRNNTQPSITLWLRNYALLHDPALYARVFNRANAPVFSDFPNRADLRNNIRNLP